MSVRRRQMQSWQLVLTADELHRLATYNGERSRGIAHTPEYANRMAYLQRRFDSRPLPPDAIRVVDA